MKKKVNLSKNGMVKVAQHILKLIYSILNIFAKIEKNYEGVHVTLTRQFRYRRYKLEDSEMLDGKEKKKKSRMGFLKKF